MKAKNIIVLAVLIISLVLTACVGIILVLLLSIQRDIDHPKYIIESVPEGIIVHLVVRSEKDKASTRVIEYSNEEDSHRLAISFEYPSCAFFSDEGGKERAVIATDHFSRRAGEEWRGLFLEWNELVTLQDDWDYCSRFQIFD